jgi:hypothetical protein
MDHQMVNVDLAQKQDIDHILELNTLVYGRSDVLTTREDFVWRHDKNPAGQAVIPVIRDDHGNVVGFIWMAPVRLRIIGNDYLAASGTNLVVHPQNRDVFGYAKLMRRFEQVFRDNNIPIHFSFISKDTGLQLRRQAPQTTWNIPVLLKPSLPPFKIRKRSKANDNGLSVKTLIKFDSRFDLFWQQIKDKYPVMAVRDNAFLTWRFAEISGRHYHILVAESEDKILGYAVLRCATIKGIKTGIIMDILITDESLGAAAADSLINQAQIYFWNQGMLLSLGLMVPSSSEYGFLRKAGYVGLSELFAPRVFHFAYFIHKSTREEMTLSAQDWFITFADYESY